MRTRDLDQIQLIDLDPKVSITCIHGQYLTKCHPEQSSIRGSTYRLRKDRACSTLLCRMCQVRFHAKWRACSNSTINFFFHPSYCRYFEADAALRSHWRSKIHKRRCKQLRQPAYTIEESERAAGLGRENKRATETVVLSVLGGGLSPGGCNTSCT